MPIFEFNWVYNGLETTLIKLDDYYPQISLKSVRSANLIQSIQPYLAISSAFFAAVSISESIHFLDERFHVIPLLWTSDFPDGEIFYGVSAYFLSWVALGALGVTAIAVSYFVNRCFKSDCDASSLLESQIQKKNTLTISHPDAEKCLQALIVARFICNAVTIIFNFTPIGTVNLALQSYSFICLAKRQWINFHLEYAQNSQISERERTKKIILDLFMRVYPVSVDEKCSICLDHMVSGVLMCERHITHLKCLAEWMNSNVQKMNQGLRNLKSKIESGIPKYTVDLKKEILPNCAECRGLPSYTVAGQIHLSDNSEHTLHVTLVN